MATVAPSWANSRLHFVKNVSMLGGLVAIGPWGLLLGPLVVRLTIEAMRIVAPDEREAA